MARMIFTDPPWNVAIGHAGSPKYRRRKGIANDNIPHDEFERLIKDVFVLGRSNYHRRYEPIWYGWHGERRSSYVGARDQDDVWEFPRPRVSNEHPTMKPVALVEEAITNSSRRGDVVLDPFLGSGTTVLAAERTGRIGAGIEIEPRYVAVALQRLADLGLELRLAEVDRG